MGRLLRVRGDRSLCPVFVVPMEVEHNGVSIYDAVIVTTKSKMQRWPRTNNSLERRFYIREMQQLLINSEETFCPSHHILHYGAQNHFTDLEMMISGQVQQQVGVSCL